jgi:hypothetical protein
VQVHPAASAPLPRVLFVLGKGGVGRSTVSAALASMFAARGERSLVFEWTIAEPIAPWFGLPPAGLDPVEVQPGMLVMSYRLDQVLRQYFVDHLGLPRFYTHVVDGPYLRQLIEAAPGIGELMFMGHVWWLTTLAEKEAGLRVDHVIVDAPATGHGASLLHLPATLAAMKPTGLLATEVLRVVGMMRDPAVTGTVVVTLAEELAAEETMELVPRATHDLGRPPLFAIVNRTVSGSLGDTPPAWLGALADQLSPAAAEGLHVLAADVRGRARRAAELVDVLDSSTTLGAIAVEEQLGLGQVTRETTPRDVVQAVAGTLAAALSAKGALR